MLADQITLRAPTAADEPFLRELYRSTREEELRNFGWTPQQEQVFIDLQFRAQTQSYALAYPNATHQIIMLSGKPIGRSLIAERSTDFVLVDIALLPEHRKQGIGKLLIERLLETAAVAGKEVRLHVQKLNPAKSLYERLGFELIGESGLYYEMRWQAEVAKT